MPAYPQTAITSKEGVNFVRATVEGNGSLFTKIEQESDLGIDGLIEFIDAGRPMHAHVAVQIKSGASFYNSKTEQCTFPIEGHRDYWSNYSLPVLGIVYVPALKTAYWINIKGFLKKHPDATSVRFAVSSANQFDPSTFHTLFVPQVLGRTPPLGLDGALALARSDKADECYLGLSILFRRHQNNRVAWDELVRTFVERPEEEIPGVVVYWLAHIPGHGDIWYHGERASPSVLAYATQLIASWGAPEVIKLLGFIDQEERIARGTLGQSVDAIISSLPQSSEILRSVLVSPGVPLERREFAAFILAMHEAQLAVPDLLRLEREGSQEAAAIRRHLTDYGAIRPY